MKKTILALAVASTAVAAQADNTTLYGDVKGTYDYTKAQGSDANSKFASSGKFGIKGSDDLGNGLSAIYTIEAGFGDVATGGEVVKDAKGNVTGVKVEKTSGLVNKKLTVGLKGEFGEVTIGKQGLPADLGNNSNPFNERGPEGKAHGMIDGEFSDNGNNSLVYKSNRMSGFKFGAAVVANGAAQEKHTDAYQVTADYDANGIFAGLAYTVSKNDAAKKKELGLGLGYKADQFSVGVEASQTKYKKAAVSAKQTFVRLGATYNVDEANSVYAGYAVTKVKTGDDKSKGKGYAIGFNHDFSKRTNAWVEYGVEKKATDFSGNRAKTKTLSLGLKTKF